MTKFADSKGREWILAVNVGAIKRVRAAADIDLADLTQATMDRLADDPCLLVDVLWVLVEKDAVQRKVEQEDFGESLVGDPIEAAVNALLEAITLFFPERRRFLLQRTLAKIDSARKKGEAMALAKLDDPALEQQMTEAMRTRMEAEIKNALTRLSSPTN